MQLFISYARSDKAIADALAADAHALGHEAFYDADLTGGQRWWDALLDQIEAAGAFVPILSDAYRASEPCRAEVEWARACGIPFLPIRTTPQSPGLYDPVIAEANWVAFDPQSRDSLAALARGLAATPPVVTPTTSPPRPPIPVTYFNTVERQLHESTPISPADQLALVAALTPRLGSRDHDVVRGLLDVLRERADVTTDTVAAVDAATGRRPEARFGAGTLLAAAGTLMWLVAVVALPWAPYKLYDDSAVLHPLLWQDANTVAPLYAAVAVLVALLVSGVAFAAQRRGLPTLVRGGTAVTGVAVGGVAVVGTIMAGLSVGAGTGTWLFLAAMLVLGAGLVTRR